MRPESSSLGLCSARHHKQNKRMGVKVVAAVKSKSIGEENWQLSAQHRRVLPKITILRTKKILNKLKSEMKTTSLSLFCMDH